MKNLLGITVVATLISAAPAFSAGLLVNGSGQLTGATAVDVGGTLYDVSFQDGTCADVFSGCDDSSDFAFDSASALVAAQALLDQVFLDGPSGLFDTLPELTSGCSNSKACFTYIPVSSTMGVYEGNRAGPGGNDFGAFTFDPLVDRNDDPQVTWAKFSIATAVPEPVTWTMMLAGFGLTGPAIRRQRRAAIGWA